MPVPLLLAAALLATPAVSADASPSADAPAGALLPPPADPVLDGLVREALERSPEFARARALVDADRQRAPQVGALPDPTLVLGIQNDGFKGLQIGTMETSYWQIMATQPFPWPGKQGAREDAARAQARVGEAQLERVRLSITAEVERGYVALLLVRGQVELLGRLETLWREAEAAARARYEVGQVPQSDLLRAQLERTRLQQQRLALEAAEATRVQALNRLRLHPLDEPIPTARRLPELGDPVPGEADAMVADAERRSPDLAQARRVVEAADRRVDVARHDRWPDLSVTAGVMLRGQLDPMWTASLGVTLPIFSASKQSKAVDESAFRREAEGQGEDAVRYQVRLRARERHALLSALVRTNQIYRGGLLVQSEATVQSTLAQYRVGRVTSASVLEALRGLVADEAGYLASLAEAQRVAIAQREVSLEAAGGAATALAGGSVPGAGGTGAGRGGATGSAGGGASGGQDAAAPAASGMGGM